MYRKARCMYGSHFPSNLAILGHLSFLVPSPTSLKSCSNSNSPIHSHFFCCYFFTRFQPASCGASQWSGCEIWPLRHSDWFKCEARYGVSTYKFHQCATCICTVPIVKIFNNISGLKTYSNWPTYPQLYVNEELIGGLDIMKVRKLSSKSVFSQPFKKRLYEWCSENL